MRAFILLILLCHTLDSIPEYYEVCNPVDMPMQLFIDEEINNLPTALDLVKNRKPVAKGASGEVFINTFPSQTYPRVAIKVMQFNEYSDTEIYLMEKMGKPMYGPKLIGCQYHSPNNWPIDLYLVQEEMTSDFDNRETRRAFTRLNKILKLDILKKMLLRIGKVWDLEYAHNDVKPANFMYKNTLNDVYITDFGMATPIDGPLSPAGSLIFICPGKFTEKKPSIKHDIYSWAVTAVVIHTTSNKIEDSELFTDPDQNRIMSYITTKKISDDCFSGPRTPECKDKLIRNVSRIMQANGWGELVRNEERNIIYEANLTSLVSHIIDYDNFTLDLELVARILSIFTAHYAQNKI